MKKFLLTNLQIHPANQNLHIFIQMRWSQFSPQFSIMQNVDQNSDPSERATAAYKWNENHRLIKYKFPWNSIWQTSHEKRNCSRFGTIMYVLCFAIIHNQIIHNFHRKYERSMLCCPFDGRGMENGTREKNERSKKTFERSTNRG